MVTPCQIALKRIEDAKKSNDSSLYLSYLRLKTIPKELKTLTNLAHLDLSVNRISNDLANLANLTNLTDLNLSGNKIQNADALGKLINLTYLNLGHNELQNADFLANLTNMKHLFLGFNKIQNVDFLQNLHRLESLHTYGNPTFSVTSPELSVSEKIGSRNEQAVYWKKLNKVITGCFCGTLQELEIAVLKEYGEDHAYSKQYFRVIKQWEKA